MRKLRACVSFHQRRKSSRAMADSGMQVGLQTDQLASSQRDGSSLVDALHDHRDALPAADAQRCQATLGLTALHLVEQRYQDPCAARPDRVSQCDCATVHIHALPVPAQLSSNGEGLRRERLVRLSLDEIDLIEANEAFAAQSLA